MKIIYLILFCILGFILPDKASAQIYLQMEKIGSTRSYKFPIGQEITFKLKGRDYFVTEKIKDFRPEKELVITESELFFANQIEELKPADFYHRRGRFFIYPLYALGGSATVAGVVGTVYERKLRPGLLLPGPVAFGVAWLLNKWIDRPYKTNKHRFRVVDLRMTVPTEENEQTPEQQEWTRP